MSLKQYTKEQLKEISLIEAAYEWLHDQKQAVPFHEMMKALTSRLELSEAEVKTTIAQFYTDLNIDGRFLCLGDNRWGLRVWYPIDQSEEDTVTPVKPKKKKAKKVVDEDELDVVEFDDAEEEEIEYDELDTFDDNDDDDEDDDLLGDDDLIEEDDLDEDFDDEDEEILETEDEYDLDEEAEDEEDEVVDEDADK
ncbi:DNA-directed RNA polymerase subunit delta [Bacillus canaveralius]|uniref:Probable DNA-directed RNA polymerase subunit delta n=1 Tax=Bacillus canaveralius TaxID=1403243 RepID=A0A2N5GGA5_9BACI|nr:DNA-directed RNA polymerase subunit delta [Bacillus canaveralius]PLR79772.1 DNA-directed RNA polymerase subunit delta [Bacillus canaveralius]PLR85500.1 DNA-directed RNA polymerase subunit delta [Bacillus sp. V33-4]PLR94521.1 DNA-directed RNA polymerase subunit delta [Bacillus canaveralius]RSK57524.1 DNA-directed RNA polymerase subunit delta [Bacillus canaveralius]